MSFVPSMAEVHACVEVAGRLTAFKVPVHIWFRDEPLPCNPAGKILKRDLRTELVGD